MKEGGWAGCICDSLLHFGLHTNWWCYFTLTFHVMLARSFLLLLLSFCFLIIFSSNEYPSLLSCSLGYNPGLCCAQLVGQRSSPCSQRKCNCFLFCIDRKIANKKRIISTTFLAFDSKRLLKEERNLSSALLLSITRSTRYQLYYGWFEPVYI